MASIEIREDKRGRFVFRIRARNGEKIAVSEGYRDKAKARAAIRSLQSSLASATVIDLTAAPTPSARETKSTKPAAKKSSKKAAKKSATKVANTSKKTAVKTASAKKAPPKRSPAAPVNLGRSAIPEKSSTRAKSVAKPTKTSSAAPSRRPSPAKASPAAVRTQGLYPAAPPVRTTAEAVRTPDDDVRTTAAVDDPATDAADDLDTVATPEGADIVTLDQLGDGEHVSSSLEPEEDDDQDNTSDAND